jgi:SAM-dependent methyltransferase
MRKTCSLDPSYFEALFAENPDPWNFETSAYEQEKYDHTLAALPEPRFRHALEIGCANGALTVRLAQRCDLLVAVDVVDRALGRARARCAGLTNVAIRKARIPRDRPQGPFDLVLLSEVAYYWDSTDLADAADYFQEVVEPNGFLLLVHWTGETDYPKTADEAVSELQRLLEPEFTVAMHERLTRYRLDLWRRRG